MCGLHVHGECDQGQHSNDHDHSKQHDAEQLPPIHRRLRDRHPLSTIPLMPTVWAKRTLAHDCTVGEHMAVRPCLEPGCPTLTRTTRCPAHTRAKDKARGTRQQRGYGAEHIALRAHYQQRMDAGESFHCWRCQAVVDPSSWHLGHDDRDRSVYRGPECPPCNLATAGR